MTTPVDPSAQRIAEPVIVLDLDAIRQIFRRRLKSWIVLWLPLFIIFLAYGLLAWPQSYTSSVSISIQQSQPSMGVLSGLPLLGGGTAAKKYIGVLKSRRICQVVSDRAGIRQLYNLQSEEDAVELTSKNVVVDDNPIDGLLYIRFTLNGPPAYGPGATERRNQVREAARLGADEFALELRRYMVYQDNDREVVLVRAAKEQLARARSDYDRAVKQLALFITRTKLRGPNMPVASPVTGSFGTESTASGRTTSGTDSAAPVTAASLLQQLYIERGRIESELDSLRKVHEVRNSLQAQQLKDPTHLPSEDTLLMQARNNVVLARIELKNLQVQYGDDAPIVRAAKAKLRNFESRLKEETDSVRRGLASEDVNTESYRSGLEAKLAALVRQIATAEGELQTNRELTTRFDALRNEVMIRLEILKTTATQSAVLGVQTVSAQSRMIVVDNARVARKGNPSKLLIGISSLFLSSLVILGWFAYDYNARKR